MIRFQNYGWRAGIMLALTVIVVTVCCNEAHTPAPSNPEKTRGVGGIPTVPSVSSGSTVQLTSLFGLV